MAFVLFAIFAFIPSMADALPLFTPSTIDIGLCAVGDGVTRSSSDIVITAVVGAVNICCDLAIVNGIIAGTGAFAVVTVAITASLLIAMSFGRIFFTTVPAVILVTAPRFTLLVVPCLAFFPTDNACCGMPFDAPPLIDDVVIDSDDVAVVAVDIFMPFVMVPWFVVFGSALNFHALPVEFDAVVVALFTSLLLFLL